MVFNLEIKRKLNNLHVYIEFAATGTSICLKRSVWGGHFLFIEWPLGVVYSNAPIGSK